MKGGSNESGPNEARRFVGARCVFLKKIIYKIHDKEMEGAHTMSDTSYERFVSFKKILSSYF
jgi:hypothetical protein